jgi:hypothetical protein
MNRIDILDHNITTPEHRITWSWGISDYRNQEGMDVISTHWLLENMGAMPIRYRISEPACKCDVLVWDAGKGDYVINKTYTDGLRLKVNQIWLTLVARLYKLTPSVVRYITYDVTPEWERWVFIRQNYDNTETTDLLIAFRNELVALQCKLALS